MESSLYLNDVFLKRNCLEKNAAEDLGMCLRILTDEKSVVLCIGSDKSMCECFAPMVGEILSENSTLSVYGTLNETVNAMNVGYYIDKIKYKHPNEKVIVVSSKAAAIEQEGEIIIKNSPFDVCGALSGRRRQIGGVCVLALNHVNKARAEETGMAVVCKMAQVAAKALILALG